MAVDRLVVEPQRGQEEHEGGGERERPERVGRKAQRGGEPRQRVEAFGQTVGSAHRDQIAPTDPALQGAGERGYHADPPVASVENESVAHASSNG